MPTFCGPGEHLAGIAPASSAWKADVLLLDERRLRRVVVPDCQRRDPCGIYVLARGRSAHASYAGRSHQPVKQTSPAFSRGALMDVRPITPSSPRVTSRLTGSDVLGRIHTTGDRFRGDKLHTRRFESSMRERGSPPTRPQSPAQCGKSVQAPWPLSVTRPRAPGYRREGKAVRCHRYRHSKDKVEG